MSTDAHFKQAGRANLLAAARVETAMYRNYQVRKARRSPWGCGTSWESPHPKGKGLRNKNLEEWQAGARGC